MRGRQGGCAPRRGSTPLIRPSLWPLAWGGEALCHLGPQTTHKQDSAWRKTRPAFRQIVIVRPTTDEVHNPPLHHNLRHVSSFCAPRRGPERVSDLPAHLHVVLVNLEDTRSSSPTAPRRPPPVLSLGGFVPPADHSLPTLAEELVPRRSLASLAPWSSVAYVGT